MIKRNKTYLLCAIIIMGCQFSTLSPMITFDPVELEKGPTHPYEDIQKWQATAQKFMQDITREIESHYLPPTEAIVEEFNRRKNEIIDSLFLINQKYPALLSDEKDGVLPKLRNNRIFGKKLNLNQLLKTIIFAGIIKYKLPLHAK